MGIVSGYFGVRGYLDVFDKRLVGGDFDHDDISDKVDDSGEVFWHQMAWDNLQV